MSASSGYLRSIARVVPFFFVVGAGMEFFMIKTGFYEIVTRKEAERRVEQNAEYERQLRRMKELNIKINSNSGDSSINNSNNPKI